MLNIDDKQPNKPSMSIPLWPMIFAIFTARTSTNNNLFTVVLAISVYVAFYAIHWLIWLIRTHFYQARIITQLNASNDKYSQDLTNLNERIDKLDTKKSELESTNSSLQSEVTRLTTNRDTLINMNNELKSENADLEESYRLLRIALLSASIGNNHIQDFLTSFNTNKEFINGTKTISHSEDNQ
ncbi:hypothetical protein [Weissella confusa]|uniref:hypothetical protein n=2 Tax=Weissella confusa TaxID=1583 RepID=UPI0018F1F13F|nr:hypothetical protein [Weissella confusa]MBJ7643123.1 hypothetical protein [Weissella confusa]MBJ7690673.1 hypothetical protein [Weissella confusa]MBJ7701093.1 hypothetical protein [Weissella confusa]